MSTLTTTTFHIMEDAPPTPVGADVRNRPSYPGILEGGTIAAVNIGPLANQIRLAGSPEQLDQLLRDALNALGEAVDAHEQAPTEVEAVPA